MPALSWVGSAGMVVCFDSLPLTRGTALSVTFGASSPTEGAEGVEKACHCEEAQRADVAIRNPRPLASLLKGAVSEAD